MVRCLLALLLLPLLAPRAAAQDGTLDPAFGDGGIVTTNVGASFYQVGHDVAVQPDGKVVVVATFETLSAEAQAVVRYLPNGTRDASFGEGGVALLPYVPGIRRADALALQPDGRIVVIRSGDAFAVTRYLPDGSLDPTFGTGGTVTTDLSEGNDAALAVAVQPDGRLIAAGGANGFRDAAAVRYLPDGSLDLTFGEGGIAVFPSEAPGSGGARAVGLQADGKIVLAGIIGGHPGEDARRFAVHRAGADGLPDASFGDGGLVVTAIGAGDAGAEALVIQPDGRIVAAGFAGGAGQPADFALARYLPNGTLDADFGEGGLVVTAVGGGADRARDLALQADGKLVAGGYTSNAPGQSTVQRFALVRYLSNGSLDPTFGGDGIVTEPGAPDGAFYAEAAGLALDADGGLVAAGRAGSAIAVARYTSDGALDGAFGTEGVVRTEGVGPGDDIAAAVLVQPDGKLVVVGHAEAYAEGDAPRSALVAARYDETGGLDADFGTGGTVLARTPGALYYIADAALQPDGRLVAAGSTYRMGEAGIDFVLARYLPDGTPDPAFGTEGISAPPILPNAHAAAVLILPNSRFLVAGHADSDVLLARYDVDGALDPSFGDNGVRSVDLGRLESVADAVLQPDGKLVVVGRRHDTVAPFTNLTLFVARFGPDGTLDPSFGTGGVTLLPGANATAVALQDDGRIVVGGWNDGFAVFGFTPDGALAWTRTLAAGTTARAVAVQPDRRIVAVGHTDDHTFVTTRLEPDGTLDTSFNRGGHIVTAVGASAHPAGIAVHPSGRIVAAGRTRNTFDFDLALVAYRAGMTVADEPLLPPPGAAALSVWPNPAAGPTTIALAVPAADRVRVAVFDVLGRHVALLHDGPLAAGEHRLALDAGLPAGVYTVRATGREMRAAHRVTFVR